MIRLMLHGALLITTNQAVIKLVCKTWFTNYRLNPCCHIVSLTNTNWAQYTGLSHSEFCQSCQGRAICSNSQLMGIQHAEFHRAFCDVGPIDHDLKSWHRCEVLMIMPATSLIRVLYTCNLSVFFLQSPWGRYGHCMWQATVKCFKPLNSILAREIYATSALSVQRGGNHYLNS